MRWNSKRHELFLLKNYKGKLPERALAKNAQNEIVYVKAVD